MRIGARALATGVVALASLAAAGPGVARAQGPAITVGADGETAPVFSYQDAIRERVFIPVAGVDQDNDGVTDRVAIDIIRPKESGPSLKVPAIIDDSPYLTSLGRGNESQRIHTVHDAGAPDGVNRLDKFPLFYDNYFVPRGYAVILAQADGTAFSTGCALHGGPGDVAGFKAVVDWTEGRVPGYTTVTGTDLVTAGWSNGKNAMIGKSYDGTFANGVAATGVDGLTTIVPISAIGAWYDYSRGGGVRYTAAGTHYPYFLSNSITQDQPAGVLGIQPPQGTGVSRNSICGGPNSSGPRAGSVFDLQLNQRDGDASGDYNDFWQERNYLKDVSKVKASVFASHGINDDNVRPNHFSQWWAGLAANNVPRKVWLSQEGHVDPFEYRRAVWVDTLHRWFDYWLQGVQNGIMNEPRVDIEQPQGDIWSTYADYPIPGTTDTDVFLAGRGAGISGSLGLASGGATDTLTFQDPPTTNTAENTFINTPNGSQANRLVFLSPKLKHDLHISGTPVIDVQASLSTTQSNFAGILVDYGQFNRPGRGSPDGDGVDDTATRTCWGDSTAADSACYLEVSKPTTNGTAWRVSRGLLDSSNRDSLFTATPAVTGTKYEFRWPILPTDYTFPAGHQIGVIIVGNDAGNGGMGVAGTRGANITVDTRNSKVILPITGGAQAATDSGGFVADTAAPVVTPAPDQTFFTGDPTGTIVTYAPPTATDNLDPNPTVSCSPASGTKFAVGTRLVTCTVTDANGNAAPPTTFNVTVRFAAQAPGDVGGSVPAALSLSLGQPAAFSPFTPGVARTYTASMTATVTSTAADALLSVADPSANATGHLVNGAFSLPQPLMARGTKAGTTNTTFGAVGSSAAPLSLLTWGGPTASEQVAIEFSQLVNANDALRTGSYSKTLTYTLSTTNP